MNVLCAMLRKVGRKVAKRMPRQKNRLGFERLEARQQLAADLSILEFSGNGSNMTVDFEVANENASEFNIAIYRSFDGVALDELLMTQWIDLDTYVGTYQTSINGDFSDIEGDYYLIAVIDSLDENTESDETNNSRLFDGGMFFDWDNVLHVHGSLDADSLVIDQVGDVSIDLNGVIRYYFPQEIVAIHARLHDSDDLLTTSSAVQNPILAYGGDGSDLLQGGSGNDLFFGGLGNDTLLGEAGEDELNGENDADILNGGDGDDVLDGGNGDDQLSGGDGSDSLHGGGDETEYYGYGDILDAGEGDDIIYGTSLADVIYGGVGDDTIYGLGGNDQLYGEVGNDVLVGGEGNDSLHGGSGDDTLSGEAGDDSLFGEEGADTLNGGSEDDYLVGGSGHDSFTTGGQSGDVVGDRPSIDNFVWSYNSTWMTLTLSGKVTDDQDLTNCHVTLSGSVSETVSLEEDGSFSIELFVPPTTGWIYVNFTDAEGLHADRMEFSIA